MLQYLVGDATNPQEGGNKVIAHVCNDLGRWGQGFVLALSQRWAKPEEEYRKWYQTLRTTESPLSPKKHSTFRLGQVQFVDVEERLWIANMLAQRGLRAKGNYCPLRYESLTSCLGQVGAFALEYKASVHMPRIGCGLAGGDWNKVEAIIQEQLVAEGLPVYVYDL